MLFISSLIDYFQPLAVVPIEVKSGKGYKRHSALSRFDFKNVDFLLSEL